MRFPKWFEVTPFRLFAFDSFSFAEQICLPFFFNPRFIPKD